MNRDTILEAVDVATNIDEILWQLKVTRNALINDKDYTFQVGKLHKLYQDAEAMLMLIVRHLNIIEGRETDDETRRTR